MVKQYEIDITAKILTTLEPEAVIHYMEIMDCKYTLLQVHCKGEIDLPD